MDDKLFLPIVFLMVLLLAGVVYGVWAALRLYQLWTVEWDRRPLLREVARWGTAGRQREIERLRGLRGGIKRR